MAKNFITNKGANNLQSRLEQLIGGSQELKFLVGFFYFSGLTELYSALKSRENLKIKILVGLEADSHAGQIVEIGDPAKDRTKEERVEGFYASLRTALRGEDLDSRAIYEQVEYFLQMMADGRILIRKTLDPNHAKLYLFRLDDSHASIAGSEGRFVTGSSNLTGPGLQGQHEFNVEIGDYGWAEAQAYFDELWESAIELSEIPERRTEITKIIRRQTQVAEITPFEAYALVLKTYLDLVEHKALRPQVKQLMEERGYTVYGYQQDAVQQALSILEEYGGVILADVVGLGKSVIASWLARERDGRGIVICPPALMGDPQTKEDGWYKHLSDFGLHDWQVYSLGALDTVLEYLASYGQDITTVIVDEAHRFRNEDTEAYEQLSQICLNRGVILLTATPVNNTPSDFFALLKLFVPPGKSTLTLDDKLADRFATYSSEFRKLSFILRYYRAGGDKQMRAEKYYEEMFKLPPPVEVARTQRRVREVAGKVRSIVEPVTIRRNRLDLRQDPVYSKEVTALSDVQDPIELFFELTPEQSRFYDQVINEYFSEDGQFRGAIYQPYAYEREVDPADFDGEGNFTYQQQRNLYEFMRRLLVKRFESSFGAFRQSVENFIRVHEMVLAFIERTGRYVLDRKFVERLQDMDEEAVDLALEQFEERLSNLANPNPRHDKVYVIKQFADGERFLADARGDLALLQTILARIEALNLVASDPKVARLVKAVDDILREPARKGESRRKIIVFSEYLDTVHHIKPALQRAFGDRVLVADRGLSKGFMSQLLSNFDAGHKAGEQRDEFDVVVATDKLSEGVNLNRAGAVINYDIPWNPTRVIQRMGRINRIGRKVFAQLRIYNFFPTEQGAEVVKSREIAAQKMFLIHNTLGEDSKVFAADETPNPSDLFARINRNPEDGEEESFVTAVRRKLFEIKTAHPDVYEGLSDFPARVKTAKKASDAELLVFQRKGLRMFAHAVATSGGEKSQVQPLLLETAITRIECQPPTPRQALGPAFWPAYEAIKDHREHVSMPQSDASLLVQAENNLRSALAHFAAELKDDEPFIQTLIRDLKQFQVLPKFTLRRLVGVNMAANAAEADVQRFRSEIAALRRRLGDQYLAGIERRTQGIQAEVVIAVENQGGAV